VALEDDLDVGGAAEIEVVGDQGLEERPGPAGRVEHQRAGHLDLAHGDHLPVPGPLVGQAEGQREAVQPPLGEHLDGARLQPVADLLQSGRVLAGREPAGSSVNAIPAWAACRLAHSCPLTQILAG
jgi:hypothetical protein